MIRPSPRSTFFPYTTLFRSLDRRPVLPSAAPPGAPFPGQAAGGDDAEVAAPPCRRAVGGGGLHAWLVRRGPRRSGSAGSDRKSTRLNSSHTVISYAVFCLKK